MRVRLCASVRSGLHCAKGETHRGRHMGFTAYGVKVWWLQRIDGSPDA